MFAHSQARGISPGFVVFVVYLTGLTALAFCACASPSGKSAPAPADEPPSSQAATEVAAQSQESVPRSVLVQSDSPSHKGGALTLAGLRTQAATDPIEAEKPVLILADYDDSALALIDLDGSASLSRKQLDCAPGASTLLADGTLAVVFPRCSELRTFRLERSSAKTPDLTWKELARAKTKTEPVALGISGAAQDIFVVSAWGRSLQRFVGEGLVAKAAIELNRDPRAVVLDDAGTQAWVSHGAGGLLSVVNLETGHVEKQSLNAVRRRPARRIRHKRPIHRRLSEPLLMNSVIPQRVSARIRHRPGRSAPLFASQGFAIARGAGKVFIPQALSNPGTGRDEAVGYGASADRFPANLQDIAVYDREKGESNRNRAQFDIIFGWNSEQKNLCRLPRAAAFDAQRSTLLVACVGSDLVVEYDAEARDPSRTEITSWRVARGPSAMAMSSKTRTLYVWSEFAREVSALSLEKDAPHRPGEHSPQAKQRRSRPTPEAKARLVVQVPLSEAKAPEILAQLDGKALFHRSNSSKISKDGRACASCHPGGRDDGLSWRTSGRLAKRQTAMLDGRVKGTQPFGWLGEHPTLQAHVEHTIAAQLKGDGLPPAELQRLVSYVETLPGPPQSSSRLTAKETRGKELFFSKSAGCGHCHQGAGRVDGKGHKLAGAVALDTPSLRFVGGSAPYFHDGTFRSLEDLLTHTIGTMGQSQPLDASQRGELVAFLRTL